MLACMMGVKPCSSLILGTPEHPMGTSLIHPHPHVQAMFQCVSMCTPCLVLSTHAQNSGHMTHDTYHACITNMWPHECIITHGVPCRSRQKTLFINPYVNE